MTRTKTWSLGALAVVLAVLAAGWFLLVSPKRGEAADLRAQTASQDSQNQQLLAKLEQLKAQAKDLPQQQAKLAEFRAQVPDNPALPSFIRDMTKVTKAAGVDLLTVTKGAPALITPAQKAAQPAPAATGAAQPPAATSAPAAATATPLYQMPVTLSVSGTFPQVELFINQLEGLKRAFLVTGFSLAPKSGGGAASSGTSDDSRTISLSLTGRVFIAPATATPAAAASPTAVAQPK